jgi:sucrose phosphorylase
MKNQVQLITYVDRFGGGGLADLQALLTGPLAGVFGGVHLLPFFHPIDGADAGFDPIDHTQVDARLGDWDDVRAGPARGRDGRRDRQPHVVGFAAVPGLCATGRASAYRPVPDAGRGVPERCDRERPAGHLPAAPGRCRSPASRWPMASAGILWTTFTPQQVDIDVNTRRARPTSTGHPATPLPRGRHPHGAAATPWATRSRSRAQLLHDARDLRLHRRVRRARPRAWGMEVLVEVHSLLPQADRDRARVDWVYDFALPPLVLHALFFGTPSR